MLKPAIIAIVAFLNAGEVWTVPATGGTPAKLTHTGAMVEDFRISKDGAYLAYEKRIAKGEDHHDITSIVVVRLAGGTVLTEIKPKEGWLTLDRWAGSTLLYHSAASLEVTGFFEYDPFRNESHELDMSSNVDPMERDVSRNGLSRLYVDDTGLGPTYRHRLHVVNTRTGADDVDAAHRSVMSAVFAPDGFTIAFVEVVDSAVNGKSLVPVFDRVWLHRVGGIADMMIHERAVQAKGGGTGLTWSTDGSRLAMNYANNVTVLDPRRAGPALRTARGRSVCWIDPDQMVFTTPDDVVLRLNVNTGAQNVVAERGTASQCSVSTKSDTLSGRTSHPAATPRSKSAPRPPRPSSSR